MKRIAYEKYETEGLRVSRVESISSFWAAGDGPLHQGGHSRHHLIMGTSDGLVVPLDCHQKSVAINPGTRAFECTAPIGAAKTIRNQSKDRRPVNVVQVAESWGAFICIIEGMLTAYDLETYEMICQVSDTKGCTNFSAHERSSSLVVATAKKRLAVYLWQGSGFALRRELLLTDGPKFVVCLSKAVVLGYKKHYEAISMSSLYATHGWSTTGEAGPPGPGPEKSVGSVVLSAGTTAAGAAISAIAHTPTIIATALAGVPRIHLSPNLFTLTLTPTFSHR